MPDANAAANHWRSATNLRAGILVGESVGERNDMLQRGEPDLQRAMPALPVSVMWPLRVMVSEMTVRVASG